MSVRSFVYLLRGKISNFLRPNFTNTIKFYSLDNNYKFIQIKRTGKKGNLGILTLTEPKNLNVICSGLMNEATEAIESLEKDESVGAIILTGNGKVFSAGGDILEMQGLTYPGLVKNEFFTLWSKLSSVKKPLIAAVNGHAVAGGCILVLACDIIYASEQANFTTPEVLIGLIPGEGGTQRIVRSIGKYKAMEMLLTGNKISAQQAEKIGLISKIFPADRLLDETVKIAETIADNPRVAVILGKESVNTAFETSLAHGLNFEKRAFHATFATRDFREGVAAFIEKRAPTFTNE